MIKILSVSQKSRMNEVPLFLNVCALLRRMRISSRVNLLTHLRMHVHCGCNVNVAPWAAYEVKEGKEKEGSKEVDSVKRRSSIKDKEGADRYYNRKDVAPFAFIDSKNGVAKDDIPINRRSVIGKECFV